jgi:hypothetical protein
MANIMSDGDWVAATGLYADECHRKAAEYEAANRLSDSSYYRASEVAARQGVIVEPRSEELRNPEFMFSHQHLFAEATRRNAWVPYTQAASPEGLRLAPYGCGAAKAAAG